jgi:hypothetical protein
MGFLSTITGNNQMINAGESKLANSMTTGGHLGTYASPKTVSTIRNSAPFIEDMRDIKTSKDADDLECVEKHIAIQAEAIKRGAVAMQKISGHDATIRQAETKYQAEHAQNIQTQIDANVDLFDVVNGQRVHQRRVQNHVTKGLNMVGQELSALNSVKAEMDF